MHRELALVLSGGGARGAYQVGALKALAEGWAGAAFALVSGSSIGAINGAVVAEGIESGDLPGALRRLEEAWLAPGRLLSFNRRTWLAAVRQLCRRGLSPDVLRAIPSLLDDEPVRRRLSALIPPDRRMGDYRRVELVVTATDLNAGDTAVFDRQTPDVPVLEAIMASAALPVVFPSRQVAGAGGHWYVDGGVFDNAPLGHVIRRGAGDVVVISTRPRCEQERLPEDPRPFSDVLAVATRLWPLSLDRLLYEDLRKARLFNEIIDIIETSPDPDSPTMRRLKALIGYEKGGRRKKVVGLLEICPDEELTPPGTFGFDEKGALRACMERGYQDALRSQREAGQAGLPRPGLRLAVSGSGRRPA